MCGIFGFNNYSSLNNPELFLKKMGQSLFHRGPDSFGYYSNDKIGMGIRRLKVIDLVTGDQPIFSNDRNLVIVFNGEIYNYLEIREILINKGYKFNTNSDTEVVVNLYHLKGLDFLNDLNGMFGLAIYDIKKNEIVIARDRFGIKPLYYYFHNNNFIFASEIKAILEHRNIEKKIDLNSIDSYFTFENIQAPYSIYKSIKKLEQGHFIKFSKNEILKKKWYQINYYPKNTTIKFKDAKEHIDNLIKKSVKICTRSDVPYGALLSSGIDSGIITSHLAKISSNKAETFSIGFEDKSFDESSDAKTISKYLETNHNEFILSNNEIVKKIPNILCKLDEPFADPSLIPTTILSNFAKKYVTVAMTGDGGDEIFGGYPTYFARQISNYIPRFSYKYLKYFSNLIPANFDYLTTEYKIKKFLKDIELNPDIRHIYWLGCMNENEKKQLFSSNFSNLKTKERVLQEEIKQTVISSNLKDNWERSLHLDLHYYLANNHLNKVDIASMNNSLEIRVPLLDNEIVDFASKLPLKFKYKFTKSKYILREIAKDHIPIKITKKKKRGFAVPISKMINFELKEIIHDILMSKKFLESDLFNNDYIQRLLHEHYNNIKNNRKEIWSIFVFAYWYENKY